MSLLPCLIICITDWVRDILAKAFIAFCCSAANNNENLYKNKTACYLITESTTLYDEVRCVWKHTHLWVHTYYAGAKLFICDVQRVSVSVEGPRCLLFTRPLPAFEMRHLLCLKHTMLLRCLVSHDSVNLCPVHTYFTVRAAHLPGSYEWRRAPAEFDPQWSWWDRKPRTALLLCRGFGLKKREGKSLVKQRTKSTSC